MVKMALKSTDIFRAHMRALGCAVAGSLVRRLFIRGNSYAPVRYVSCGFRLFFPCADVRFGLRTAPSRLVCRLFIRRNSYAPVQRISCGSVCFFPWACVLWIANSAEPPYVAFIYPQNSLRPDSACFQRFRFFACADVRFELRAAPGYLVRRLFIRGNSPDSVQRIFSGSVSFLCAHAILRL